MKSYRAIKYQISSNEYLIRTQHRLHCSIPLPKRARAYVYTLKQWRTNNSNIHTEIRLGVEKFRVYLRARLTIDVKQ